MKKGLLLSIVASTVVFAGGDIYPVEPVTEVPAAPVASCGDFSGSIGAYYETKDVEFDNAAVNKHYTYGDKDLFDTEISKFDITAALAVEKKIGYGLTLGAEVAGWQSSAEVADDHRTGSAKTIVYTNNGRSPSTGGELSQLWIAKSFGNTAIKVGRQALPASLMPFAWTDTTAGVKDATYEGVIFANTSLANTTIYGGYVGAIANGSERTMIDEDLYEGMDGGLYALGFRTTAYGNLGLVAYSADKYTGVWGDASFTLGSWNAGVQGVYSDVDVAGADSTYAAALKVTKDFGNFDAKVVVSYINDGNAPLVLSGTGGSFWGDLGENSEEKGVETTAIGGVVSYKNVLNGKVYVGASYKTVDNTDEESLVTGTVGYKTTTKSGLGIKAEYKYYSHSFDKDEARDHTASRVRLEAVYKF